MKVVVFGASGMIGQGVVIECLEDNRIEEVVSIVRKPTSIDHPKLREVIHKDFLDLSAIRNDLQGLGACYFCLGISSFRMSEEDYSRITLDFTKHIADTLKELNPSITMSFISGQGTDANSSTMWSRIKGAAEEYLKTKNFRSLGLFRPGYIQPKKGATSKTVLYRVIYVFVSWLYPLFKALGPNSVTSTVEIGKAMINSSLDFEGTMIFNPKEINEWASK